MGDRQYIGFEIHTLDRMIGRQSERITQQQLGDEIPALGAWIIRYIYHHGEEPIYQRDIERKFCMPASTVTKIIKQLEKDEYIKREFVENDARLKRLLLTEKGAFLAQTIMQVIHQEVDAKLTAGLSEEELSELFRMIAVLKANAASLGK